MRATYRLQLEPALTFDDVAGLVPYFQALGISHLYTSPVFEAVTGSRHGYDVVNPQKVRTELGGDAGLARLIGAARAAGLGLILDIVPNHQALEGNPWWWDVLEHGASSPYFEYFDLSIDDTPRGVIDGIVLPVLGEPYGIELEAGKISIVVEGDRPLVAYGTLRFPLSPESTSVLATGPDGGAEPAADAGRADALRRAADALNADPERLHELLERQNYRLAWWRLARDETPYRRFFDVNSLIGVRVDREDVFTATHRLIADWAKSGDVDGFRVDHIDGLADPAGYLARLRSIAPTQWIAVEKILAAEEDLPDWPVDGTTGYEVGAVLTRLFTAAEGEAPLTSFYERFTGLADDFATVADDARHEVLGHWLSGDSRRVARLLYALCQRDIRLRDYSLGDAESLVREFVAASPVYRTYVTTEGSAAGDAARLDAMFARMRQRCPDLPAPLVNFAAHLIAHPGSAPGVREFVARLQQLSTAVAAKAVEDTAFYRYNRYIALNEVGGDPALFSTSVAAFHTTVSRWQSTFPAGLRGTSTHDSKRAEDVRARLTVLSEIPHSWSAVVERWGTRSDAHRIDGQPERNFEYYIYQTLVGAWPLTRERAHVHVEKAMREAKLFTNWLTPSAEYEHAVHHFIDRLYGDQQFIDELDAFVRELHPADWTKALAQLLLKLTLPGVPDIYQGCELWALQLADPDNRAPVDYGERRAMLTECRAATVDAVMARIDEGLPKMWTLTKTLELKARVSDLLPTADYRPLELRGDRASSVVAFLRGRDVAVIVPIRTTSGAWTDVRAALPEGVWFNVLTDEEVQGGEVAVRELFARFPVALLERRTPREARA
jgi:(1->4)-alpha-D-glucan 1-alpha-D-glucosylmutase